MFFIEQTSGAIFTQSLLDRETTPSYSLTAFATDKGTPPQTSTVSIQIIISDEDDNSPTIQISLFEQNFVEGGSLTTVIAENSNVLISDLDDMTIYGVFEVQVSLLPNSGGSKYPLPGG